MPPEACLQAAYDFMNEHRAKPVSEMKQSGIELSTVNLWLNKRKSGAYYKLLRNLNHAQKACVDMVK